MECWSPKNKSHMFWPKQIPTCETRVCGSISILGGFFSTHCQRFRRYRGIPWRVLRAFNGHTSATHAPFELNTFDQMVRHGAYVLGTLAAHTNGVYCSLLCYGHHNKGGFPTWIDDVHTRSCTGIQRSTCRDFRDIGAVLFRVQEWSECARISIIIILFPIIDVRKIFFLNFFPLSFPVRFHGRHLSHPIRSLQPLIYTFLFPRITLRS